MDSYVEVISLMAVICTVLIVFALGLLILSSFLFSCFKFAANKYVDAKSKYWAIRRWSQQEVEIERLKSEIESLKKKSGG